MIVDGEQLPISEVDNILGDVEELWIFEGADLSLDGGEGSSYDIVH